MSNVYAVVLIDPFPYESVSILVFLTTSFSCPCLNENCCGQKNYRSDDVIFRKFLTS